MPSISDFKSQLIQGGFRPNQFQCSIVFPAIIPNGRLAGQKTLFMAKSGQLPASTLTSVPVSYRGRPVKFAGEREFQPWTIDVYTDTDFVVRDAFEAWVDTMQRSNTTGGALRPAVYQTDLSVQALDRNDRVSKTYRFVDAFPTEVGSIALDWESNNQIATFQVTFEYNYFESVGAQGAIVA
jgi:hypothetical protein